MCVFFIAGSISSRATPAPEGGKAVPCARAEKRVELPAEFPKDVPLPPGTAVTSAQRTENRLLVQGFIPMDLRDGARFFIEKIPAAGFQLGRGESEEGEAEAPFRGNGITGVFKLRTSRDCPGWLELVMIVQPMP